MPFIGQAPLPLQGAVAALLMSTNLPVYVTIEFEDRQKAERLLTQFSERIFLEAGQIRSAADDVGCLSVARLQRASDVCIGWSVVCALTLRLHIALVGDQFVLSTRPEVLREVIDASQE